MLYSKGDTIELKDGLIALVLDNGMTHEEFYHQNANTTICEINFSGELQYWTVSRSSRHLGGNCWIWYLVLIGDTKGWYAIYKGYDDAV